LKLKNVSLPEFDLYQRSPYLIIITLILLVISTSCQSSAEKTTQSAKLAEIDTLMKKALDDQLFAGAVIRIQHEDTLLYNKAYGFADRFEYNLTELERPVPMTTHHIFDLASLTKVFATTFGIMWLVDQDYIQLDDAIHTWLPEFNTGDKKNITLRHLLTHSSGLPQWYPLYYEADNKEERYQAIAQKKLLWPVGEERHYSDFGFMLLGDIIEKVSGQPLDVFLEENIFTPLQLQHTTFNPLNKRYQNLVATSHGNPFERKMVHDDNFGYNVDVDPTAWDNWRRYTLKGEVNDGNAWYANEGVAGHAGLFSTASDLQEMIDILLKKDMNRDIPLFSSSVIDTFLTKNRFGNALGWAMDKNIISAKGTPPKTFGHTGFTGTNVVVIPEYKFSVILLTNRQHFGVNEAGSYPNLRPLRQKIIDVLMNKMKQ